MSAKLEQQIVLHAGKWIITQDIYYFKNKKIKNEQNIISAFKTNKVNQTTYYTKADKIDLILFSYKLSKKITNYIHNYKIINKKCISIKIKKYKNQSLYTEYIYKLNDNLNISIGLLSDSTKVIAISFITYIKKTDKS